jgi:hypothetical protein
VEQEAADELDRVESHDAAAVVMSGISPAKAHLSVVEAEQPPVGDGHAVGVAGQVLEDMFRSAEWRLGVDHPISPTQHIEQGVKCARFGECSQPAGEA